MFTDCITIAKNGMILLIIFLYEELFFPLYLPSADVIMKIRYSSMSKNKASPWIVLLIPFKGALIPFKGTFLVCC